MVAIFLRRDGWRKEMEIPSPAPYAYKMAERMGPLGLSAPEKFDPVEAVTFKVIYFRLITDPHNYGVAVYEEI